MKTKVYQLKLSISNAYLICGEACILVDSGQPNEGQKVIQLLNQIGFNLNDITLIIHTHGHSDHCGSTRELLDLKYIPTAIHAIDAHMITYGKNEPLKAKSLFGKLIKPFVDKPFSPFKPDILINYNFSLQEYGINGMIYHTPGHTKGSISIKLENGDAVIGDLLMGGYLGGKLFPSIPKVHYFLDNYLDWKNSIEKVHFWNSSNYFVGHGGPLTTGKTSNYIKNKTKR